MHEIIAKRWSPRAFDSSKPITKKQLLDLAEAARWAPSCYGYEPWRFLIWDRFADKSSWQRAFDCLVPFNQAWVKNAPILMLCVSDTLLNGNPNRFCQYDAGAASENLALQAASMGLAAHQMGGYDDGKIRAEFDIPEQYVCLSMIAVGFPGNPDILGAELKERELARRTRNPVETRFFEGKWGSPLKS